MKLEDTLVLYVNLDHRTDRRTRIEEVFKTAGLNAERVRGLLPKECDPDNPKHQTMVRRTIGALGCHYSQVSCMERAMREGKDVIISEDDIYICEDFKSVRMPIIEGFCNTHEWDVVFLGGTVTIPEPAWHTKDHNNPELRDCKCTLGRDIDLTDNPRIIRVYGAFSTYFYLVNHKSIPKLLKMFDENIHRSIGIDFMYIMLAPYLNCFMFMAGCAGQIDNMSDIGNGLTVFSNFKFLGKHFYSNRMEDFDPATYNWGEAAIKTTPIHGDYKTEILPVEIEPKVTFEPNSPEYFFQQVGIYDELVKSGLLSKAIDAVKKFNIHKLDTNLHALQKELFNTCRFDCSFYINKYMQ